MSFITTKDGSSIFYKDWGPKDAQPIMFHHGWPLSADDWDAQMLFFLHLASKARIDVVGVSKTIPKLDFSKCKRSPKRQ